jgi:2-alkyl-3-oxoalkanoate reductase
MKVLVTGGSGFLGGYIVEELIAAGHEVRALVRGSSNTKHLSSLQGVELAKGSVDDVASLQSASAGMDGVIHSAGLVKARNEKEFISTNVDGTRFVAESAKQHGLKRMVLVSSLEATGPSKDGTPAPTHQETPMTAYGRSKLAAEKEALKLKGDIHLTVVRPGAVYGPRDIEIFEAFKAVSRGLKPVFAGGSARGSFIFARDCAQACVKALDAKTTSGAVYHAVDDTPMTQVEFFAHVEEALGKKALLSISLPKFLLKGAAYGTKAFGQLSNKAVMLTPEKADMLLMHWVADSKDTQRDLNWKPQTTMPVGCAAAVSWYREQKWL